VRLAPHQADWYPSCTKRNQEYGVETTTKNALEKASASIRFEPLDMPLLHWLLFSFAFALIYVVFLLQMDASQTRSLKYRQTSETHSFFRAANNHKKPSPFGAPARTSSARVRDRAQAKLALALYD
jgi:hypothetical protein